MAIADETDQQIVALLRENARRSFQDIGARVSLSAPAVKRRVDRLEADGVIRGYAATIEPTAFGWHSHAFVELFCEGRMSGAEVSAADGVTNMFVSLCEAAANGRLVHVEADNQLLYTMYLV